MLTGSNNTRWLCIYGPPGTGKTRNLTAIFLQAAEQHGTQRCAAVTYTKAAGLELKNRLGQALRLGATEHSLNAQLPYVGTIHSLCYRSLSNPKMVDNKAFADFCHEVRIDPPAHPEWADHMDDRDELPGLEVKEDEAQAFRMILGAARHRMISIDEMFEQWVGSLSGHDLDAVDLFSADRIKYLAAKYDLWKRSHHLYDFEDLLEEGAKSIPPIRFLICDEVQDNSKLMWHVVDTWGKHCQQVVLAGDPFQSIYLFSGADPRLFINHPGEKVLLKESHRLTQGSVTFATDILRQGGWNPEEIGEWFGQEEPKGMDGSVFYLARTHRLLGSIRAQLMDSGEPFLELRGSSPWESPSGQAYRILTTLMQGEVQPRSVLAVLAKALRRKRLGVSQTRLNELSRERGSDPVWEDEVRVALGGLRLAELRENLDYFAYLHRVETKHGTAGLWFKPSISLGTIHASKGREADVVNLVRSWARRPAASLLEDEGRRGEACIAYVGATRHRTTLNLLDAEEGIDYDWPDLTP